MSESGHEHAWDVRPYTRLGRTGRASTQARLQALLEREWATLGAKVRDTALATTLVAGAEGWDGPSMQLARVLLPAAHVGDALARVARAAGVDEQAVKEARAQWLIAAQSDIERWTEAIARADAWERTREALEPLAIHLPGGLALARWAALTRRGERLARALEERAPWLAGEAARHLDEKALAGDEDTWLCATVRGHARRVGRTDAISDASARDALAAWRWPNVRPPLGIVAAGAGILAPIRRDGGWANAAEADAHESNGAGWVDPVQWARKERAKEGEIEPRLTASLHRVVRQWARRRGGRPRPETIERWERAWGTNAKLAGDGRSATLEVEERTQSPGTLGWTVRIEGPKALIARCVLQSEDRAQIAGRWRAALGDLARAGGTRAVRFELALSSPRADEPESAEEHAPDADGLGAPIGEMGQMLGEGATA